MQLARFARRRYTPGATPLEPLARLSAELGGPELWMKRDDLLGLAGGGNKTRKLEFLVADALAEGADTLITVGAVQSNHCRLTLAAAAREGLKCRLILEERVPDSFRPDAAGNHLLYRLMGVERFRVVPAGTDLGAAMTEEVERLAVEGRKGYPIPGGGSNPLGALGYASCARELIGQAFAEGLPFDHLVVASGSGGTHAGLLAGLTSAGAALPVTGVSVRHPEAKQAPHIQALAQATLELAGAPHALPSDAVSVDDRWVGPGYSLPTEAMVEAVRMLARVEGILLDPVYTGKAMAGLIGQIREGRYGKDDKVLFLHTGGAPSLSAYGDDLVPPRDA